MKLPFTSKEFMQVFRDYNTAVFPMQIIFYLLAITVLFYLVRKNQQSDKVISIILSFFWLWMGLVYHIIYFTTINKAAYIFGTAFIIQSLIFLWKGIYQKKLNFSFQKNFRGMTGLVLVLFALVVYPFTGYLDGHIYPASSTFGLPCPTTIFSFGILLFLRGKCPLVIMIIPFAWSIIGFSAAFSLGIKEDISLIISAIASSLLLLRKNYQYEKD